MLLTIDEDEKTTITNSNSGGSKIFLTEDGLYEVLMQSRKPIAKDVAEQIEHSKVTMMLNNVDEDEKVKVNNTYLENRTGGNGTWFLTEDGLYEVLKLEF